VANKAAADYSIGGQVWIQLQGVLVTIVWSGVVAFIAFKIVDLVIGLRVTEEEEREGLDINRVGHARLVWNGTSHPLVTHQGNDPHAIHGIGWQRPWQVLEQTDTLLLLSMEHRADAAWPFAFDASQGFRLSGDALEMTLSVTNQSKVPAPVGLGWHPFFVKRPGARIAFDATGRWEMGPDKLPTGRVRSRGMAVDAALLDVDHCFDGWKGAVTLSDEQLAVRVSSSLRRLVVFTNGQRGDIAVEPVSHVNNAINLLQAGHTAESLGVQVLAPGASLSAEMTIQVEHSK
jgi:aldose 1-epimerase